MSYYDDDDGTVAGPGARRPGTPRPRRSGPSKPKSWVPLDEHGDPVELTPEQTAKLRERATNLCLWHLGQGPKTRQQLVETMRRKNVPADMIEGVLDKLAEYNYVNDETYAENYVRSRHTNQHKGASALRYELRRKGIDDATVTAALEQVTEDSERAAATHLVRKKLASTVGLDSRKRVNRLVAMLARKGYPPGLAYQVVRDAIAAEGDDETLDDLDTQAHENL